MVDPANWTTSSLPDPYQIYTGVWTNWSRGSVMGVTLTISRNAGNLLIAFVATFVGLVSTRLWYILCIYFHRYHSSLDPKDVVHHQRQAILRNSASSEGSFWKLLQLRHAWRHGTQRASVRLLPILGAAALCFLGFTVAGGFSSHISTGISNAVLVDGVSCGRVSLSQGSDFWYASQISDFVRFASEGILNSMSYAQQCYSRNRTGVLRCGSFVVPRLGSSVDTQAPCPFADALCRSNDKNIRLDSGYIDSHTDLGLNSPPLERVLQRVVLHCAPLKTQGYRYNFSDQYINYTAYSYGPTLFSNGSDNLQFLANYTYRAPTLAWQYIDRTPLPGQSTSSFWTSPNHIIVGQDSVTVNGTTDRLASQFDPIPGLARADADLTLFFLQGNGVLFLEPVDDLWYRATVPAENLQGETTGELQPAWQSEEAASPLGCAWQAQYCNTGLPEDRRCGPLASPSDAWSDALELFNLSTDGTATDMNGMRFNWLFSQVTYVPAAIVNTLGPQSLISSRSLRAGMQAMLPINQWQLDVTNWWQAVLASYQLASVVQAAGPNDPSLAEMVVGPNGTNQESLCRSQMVLSTDYTSFSMFGLCFIFASGTLIIIASFVIEPILSCQSRRSRHKLYKLREWQTSEALQLQRIGYQGLGMGIWSRGTDVVPLAGPNDLLESLALLQGELKQEEELNSNDKKAAIKCFLLKALFWVPWSKTVKRKTETRTEEASSQGTVTATMQMLREPPTAASFTNIDSERPVIQQSTETHQPFQAPLSATVAVTTSSMQTCNEEDAPQDVPPVSRSDMASNQAPLHAGASGHDEIGH